MHADDELLEQILLGGLSACCVTKLCHFDNARKSIDYLTFYNKRHI